MQMRTLFAVSVFGILATTTATRAGLIAGDSYVIGTDPTVGQYVNNAGLKSAAANLTTTGFLTGPYNQGQQTANFTSTSGGLASVGAQSDNVSSGKVNWVAAPADSVVRSVARTLTPLPAASTGTYWISHVVNRGNITTPVNGGYVLTGFGTSVSPSAGTTSGNLAGLYVGFADTSNAANFGNLVIRYRDTSGGATSSDAVLIDGSVTSTFSTTYLVVAKIDLNSSGSTDKVTYWLNPTNGSSEATLNSSSASTGTFDSFAFQNSADFNRLNYYAFNYNGSAFFDEPRLSTDLTGLSLAVPEPTTLAAVAGAGLAMLRRRRRA